MIKTLNTNNRSCCSYGVVVFRRSQKAFSSHERRISRSFTTRATSSSSSSSDEKEKNVNIALVGQETSTGKLVMGLSAGRGNNNNNNNTISVVFGEKMENSETMTEGMDAQTFEKRFYCTKEQFAKISTFASERSASTVSASSTTTTYIFCHESGAKQMK